MTSLRVIKFNNYKINVTLFRQSVSVIQLHGWIGVNEHAQAPVLMSDT